MVGRCLQKEERPPGLSPTFRLNMKETGGKEQPRDANSPQPPARPQHQEPCAGPCQEPGPAAGPGE